MEEIYNVSNYCQPKKTANCNIEICYGCLMCDRKSQMIRTIEKTRKPQTYKVYCLEWSFLKSDELVLLNFRNKSFPIVISGVHPSIKAQSTVILTVWCQPFIKVNTWWERHKFSDFWYFSDKTFNILFL